MNKGFFIALEGIDGSGKTTLRESLARWLKIKTGRDVIIGWEPKHEDQGIWAKKIRHVLKGKIEAPSDPLEFQRLYIFDRAENVHFTINPELAKGNIVLYDRYLLSTLAYGMLSDISAESLIDLHHKVIGAEMTWPHVHIVLDLDPSVALSRKSGQYEKPEFFEKTESLKKIRNAYLELARRKWIPQLPIFIVDADQPMEDVQAEIQAILEPLLKEADL
jgi:dTMP kinase